MDNRDHILISWPSRDIEGTIFPLIQDLAERFHIIVFVMPTSAENADSIKPKLDLLLKKKVIVDYYIAPKMMEGFLFHLYMKKSINLLQKYNIKLWLCCSDMQILEKYISNELVKSSTKIICLCPNITFLFMYEQDLAKKLLSCYEYKEEIVYSDRGAIGTQIRNVYSRKKSLMSFINYIYLKKDKVFIFFTIRTRKYLTHVLNRYIYPLLMVGKTYGFTKKEKMTQLSNGNATAYIFFDDYEVKAHKKLYKNNNIFLSYIGKSSEGNYAEKKILGTLSGWEGCKLLDQNILDMYVKDFIKVCELYKTNFIDLRPHPDMNPNSNYASQIAELLISKGINCDITSCDNPVQKESEKYICVAGFASASLRDIRLYNQSIRVVGFESVSKHYFSDPKFAFGSSDGIDWLNSNGDFVKSNKLNLNNRLSVSEVINKVYDMAVQS